MKAFGAISACHYDPIAQRGGGDQIFPCPCLSYFCFLRSTKVIQPLTVDEHWHEVTSRQRQSAGEDQHPHLQPDRRQNKRTRLRLTICESCTCSGSCTQIMFFTLECFGRNQSGSRRVGLGNRIFFVVFLAAIFSVTMPCFLFNCRLK